MLRSQPQNGEGLNTSWAVRGLGHRIRVAGLNIFVDMRPTLRMYDTDAGAPHGVADVGSALH